MFIERRFNNWWYFGRRVRVRFETNWRSRPYPYWFHAKYDSRLKHRICIPFFCIDIIDPTNYK